MMNKPIARATTLLEQHGYILANWDIETYKHFGPYRWSEACDCDRCQRLRAQLKMFTEYRDKAKQERDNNKK